MSSNDTGGQYEVYGADSRTGLPEPVVGCGREGCVPCGVCAGCESGRACSECSCETPTYDVYDSHDDAGDTDTSAAPTASSTSARRRRRSSGSWGSTWPSGRRSRSSVGSTSSGRSSGAKGAKGSKGAAAGCIGALCAGGGGLATAGQDDTPEPQQTYQECVAEFLVDHPRERPNTLWDTGPASDSGLSYEYEQNDYDSGRYEGTLRTPHDTCRYLL